MSNEGQWRWLFCRPIPSQHDLRGAHDLNISDLNLPICGVALVMVTIFLQLPVRIHKDYGAYIGISLRCFQGLVLISVVFRGEVHVG